MCDRNLLFNENIKVVKVLDHKTKQEVALKIIRSPKKFHLQAKIEVKILNFMMKNQAADYNITELKDYFVFRKHVVRETLENKFLIHPLHSVWCLI